MTIKQRIPPPNNRKVDIGKSFTPRFEKTKNHRRFRQRYREYIQSVMRDRSDVI